MFDKFYEYCDRAMYPVEKLGEAIENALVWLTDNLPEIKWL